MVATAYPRKFVPADFDPSDLGQINTLYGALQHRALHSTAELERWLDDVSELSAVLDEFGARRYIDKSCHTDDPELQRKFLEFVEKIEPAIKPLFFALQKKFLDSPHRSGLTGERYLVLERSWRADVEIFRDENVPLQTDANKAVNEYDTICGEMTIRYREKEYTLQQAARFLELTERPVRQEVWELIWKRRMQDRDRINPIFDRLLDLRHRIARNAGVSDFRAYLWKAYKRFDYTPEDCHRFAQAIEGAVVPLMRKLSERRRADLKLDKLRPWDMDVDPFGRPPLRPFGEEQVDLLVDRTRDVFHRLSPALADDFESLRTNNNLDLKSRKGKQPGGYQSNLEEQRRPFIFMNAAGLQSDVVTLLHEGGHAFHSLAAREEPLVFLRSAPIEFCEVASMSMELLGADHYDAYYSEPAQIARARRLQLERVVRVLPWIATIDQFQHWLYTNPGHSLEQRTRFWLSLMDRFGDHLDWSGYEDIRASRWHAQLHLFSHPFYYVEYGIAQLGALQVWLRSRQDPRAAIANYRAALSLGGTRRLPDLFNAAGIRFDFSERTLRPLIDAVAQELDQLPA